MNLMLGVTLRWANIPSRRRGGGGGEVEILLVITTETGINPSLLVLDEPLGLYPYFIFFNVLKRQRADNQCLSNASREKKWKKNSAEEKLQLKITQERF